MTRAKQSLCFSRAIYRRSYGEERLRASVPSRFLAEIPGELIEAVSGSLAEPGETRRYEADPITPSIILIGRQRRRTSYGQRPNPRAAPKIP